MGATPFSCWGQSFSMVLIFSGQIGATLFDNYPLFGWFHRSHGGSLKKDRPEWYLLNLAPFGCDSLMGALVNIGDPSPPPFSCPLFLHISGGPNLGGGNICIPIYIYIHIHTHTHTCRYPEPPISLSGGLMSTPSVIRLRTNGAFWPFRRRQVELGFGLFTGNQRDTQLASRKKQKAKKYLSK